MNTTTNWFPAGKYYIGDLCYVMHSEWDEVCGKFFEGRTDHGCNQGEFTLNNGTRFVSYNTKWGDGTYKDNSFRSYSVDAGLIGLIAVEDIDLSDDDNHVDGGMIVEFKLPFNCEGEDGVMRFGNVMIDTDTDTEPEYDEEEEYDDA
jgi:hypothetical protein